MIQRVIRPTSSAVLLLWLSPGCLFFADPPTSVKLLEPDPQGQILAPEDGGVVSGIYQVDVLLISNLDVSGTLYVDDQEVGSGEGPGFSWSWDTWEWPRSSYTLRLDVEDDVERQDQVELRVRVDQVPVVEIFSPSAGETIEGRVEIDFEVEDDGLVGLTWVSVGGDALDEDVSSPSGCTWTAAMSTAAPGIFRCSPRTTPETSAARPCRCRLPGPSPWRSTSTT